MDRRLRERVQRQIDFSGIGVEGQRRLSKSRVVQVGCGGLGSTLAQCVGRAGIKALTIIDKDRVDLTNLHRQFLFTEAEARRGAGKARAGAARIRAADSGVEIKAEKIDLTAKNAGRLLKGHHLVLDGLDNLPSRMIINDWCVKHRVPLIYGAVAGSSGMVMTVLPGQGPCLRCLFPEPDSYDVQTVATAGIVNALPALVAALQATEALKVLVDSPEVVTDLRIIDPWSGHHQQLQVKRDPRCRCCGQKHFDFLEPD